MQHKGLVCVVDDDAAVRSSLLALLETAGFRVEIYATATEFLRDSDRTAVGCAIVDLRMPEIDGLELQRRMKDADMAMPVIFITAFGEVPSAVQAMKAGAIDFIEKPFDDDVMISTVRFALELAERQSQSGLRPDVRARINDLSPRELEVFRFLIAGMANKEIGRELNISPRTIEIHRGNLMRKLGTRNVMQLARIAVELGIEAAGPGK